MRSNGPFFGTNLRVLYYQCFLFSFSLQIKTGKYKSNIFLILFKKQKKTQNIIIIVF